MLEMCWRSPVECSRSARGVLEGARAMLEKCSRSARGVLAGCSRNARGVLVECSWSALECSWSARDRLVTLCTRARA